MLRNRLECKESEDFQFQVDNNNMRMDYSLCEGIRVKVGVTFMKAFSSLSNLLRLHSDKAFKASNTR